MRIVVAAAFLAGVIDAIAGGGGMILINQPDGIAWLGIHVALVAFALVLTFSAVLWMKSLQYQWFSAMYGVYFFASSVWAGLAFIYVIAASLLGRGILTPVLKKNYFYYIGVLLLAFTLLSSYAEFAQYFVVWNANVPEETFWYLIRENGWWWTLSMILILGKFFVPFFALLPIHTKTNFKVLIPTCLLIAVMHAADLFKSGFDAGN